MGTRGDHRAAEPGERLALTGTALATGRILPMAGLTYSEVDLDAEPTEVLHALLKVDDAHCLTIQRELVYLAGCEAEIRERIRRVLAILAERKGKTT